MGSAGTAGVSGSAAGAVGASTFGAGAGAGAGWAADFAEAVAAFCAAVFAAGCVGVELQPAISKLSAIGVAVRAKGSFMGKRERTMGNLFGSMCLQMRGS